jgi:glucose/arabinose dehydrogenase
MRHSARNALLALVLAAIACAAIPAVAGAAVTVPTGFQMREAFAGLTEPTAVRFAPNSNLVFVAEKRGTIQVFDGVDDVTPTQVINLRREVYNNGDRGLLGLEVDPQFGAAHPYIYALYTRDATFAATTGAVADNVASRHQLDNPPSDPDTTDADGDCGGQLYGAAGCEASGRLVRIEVDPATGVKVAGTPPNPKPLVSGWCQQFSTHSVGDLRFGQDGQLYASAGDGAGFDTVDFGQLPSPGQAPCPDAAGFGGALRAQAASSVTGPTPLNGAILRVDPATGAPSAQNPFTTGDVNRRRIVGYGLRNPYRFAFRPGTSSELWLGDVGWNRWEEIDRIGNPKAAPKNFGWPCYEGDWADSNPNHPYDSVCSVPYASVTAPVFSYYHTQVEGQCFPTQFRADYNEPATPFAGSSITGMAFYAGGTYPSSYDGGLFFGDYARGCLWFMGTTAGVPDPAKVTAVASWDPGAYDPVYLPADIGLVGLERGPGGDIFIVDIANGVIRRLLHGAVDARASATITGDGSGVTVELDAGASFSTTGAALTRYEWDLDGNGSFETDTGAVPTVPWPLTNSGATRVRVRVTDENGKTGISDPVPIELGNRPVPTIVTPAVNAPHWSVGDQIGFSGTAKDSDGNPIPAQNLKWDLIIRHCTTSGDCHSHFAGGSLSGLDGGRHGAGGTFIAPDHSYPSHLELQLTATDPVNGLSFTVARRLDPETVDLVLASEPSGRTLTANDRTAAAPFICTVIKGSQTTISAAASDVAGGTVFQFDSWSNGGPIAQTFIADAARSLTARYTGVSAPATGPPAAPSPAAAAPLGGPVPGAPPVAVRPAIRLGGTLRVSRRGAVSLRVRCPGPGACRASVRLDTVAAKRAAARRIAAAVVRRIGAGRTATVAVKLGPSARRLLAARRTLKAIATVAVTPAGRAPVTTRTSYILRAPAR